jgi:hypothetical protein
MNASSNKAAEKQDEPLKKHGDKFHVESGDEKRSGQRKGGKEVELSPAGPGDERTPDQPIGQVAYAEKSGQRQGGAGEPQTAPLEPEKQGGIGGP